MSNEQKLREIYRRHELATTGLVLSDFERIAKDIIEALALPTTDPELELTGCNCRWKGETQVEWCEHHRAHLDAIHDWAQRAKAAESKLKAALATQPQAQDHLPDAGKMAAQELPDERALPPLPEKLDEIYWPIGSWDVMPVFSADQMQDYARAALAAKPVPDDAELIDFLQSVARCDPKMDGNHVWWPLNWNTCQTIKGPTLREAIRAAIAAQGGK